ncbi:MAG: hypothetical protein Q8R48_06770, partial [Candidatus Omnitrophota bacterium]|nr:hypothetical protein [Candidatus Omnitrophota bacterium]
MDGERIDVSDPGVEVKRTLNMEHGVETIEIMRTTTGTRLIVRLFMSHSDAHTGAAEFIVIPGGKGTIRRKSSIDPNVGGSDHWTIIGRGEEGDVSYMSVKTRQSGITVTEAVKHRIPRDAKIGKDRFVELLVKAGTRYVFEDILQIYTSLDSANPENEAVKKAGDAAPFGKLLKAQEKIWAEHWKNAGIRITGEGEKVKEYQRAINFMVYQLISLGFLADGYSGMGAKGYNLPDDGYRGHHFWDFEIFVFPFFCTFFPEVARNFLRFRYHT